MLSKIDFESLKRFDRDNVLNELEEIIRYSDIKLSGSKEKLLDYGKLNKAVDIIKKLKTEIAQLPPLPDVVKLSTDKLSAKDDKIRWKLQEKLKRYSFYEIEIPITLFPKSGWAFTRIDCMVEFYYQEIKKAPMPIVYDLFPEESWAPLLKIKNNLEFGINANFEYGAKDDSVGIVGTKLPDDIKGKIGANLALDAIFVSAAFNYTLKRSEIRTAGKGHSFGRWRMDGQEHLEHEDVILKVVLMAPINFTKFICARAALIARHDFQLWTSDIFKDWRASLSEAIRAFFNNGAYVSATAEWINIIPEQK